MITKEQVLSAQEKWGNGVVKIGSLKDSRKECEAYTNDFLDSRYAFEIGPVLFKPTKCEHEQFRPTKLDALSYFIAGDDRAHDEDKGFALAPWIKVKFKNDGGIILEENRAIAMGNYFFTDEKGNIAKVEYTFGYKLMDGELKIDVHHSSFPFSHPEPVA
ncbi:hypothetical protein [uncultured Kordia sp.]|uniref:hypothetical protein n=1 Tax=uncultured Kordia sp. TaxID=507699 RepID=UPI002602FAF6|nr:hypothetical protein [uncultured Kordia sp.]